MTKENLRDVVAPEAGKPGWRALYIAGAVAAFAAVLVFRRFLSVELVEFNGFGIWDVPSSFPSGAAEWFVLLQRDRLMGLVLLDAVDLVNYSLVGLILLAVYAVLRQTYRGAATIALACGLVGVGVYLASNQAFSMLSLRAKYAAASEAERVTFVAAGEALLAIHQGTGIQVSFCLVTLAGLIDSLLMLREKAFGRFAAWTGILANGFAIAFPVTLAFVPAISWLPPTLSAPFRIVWYVLIAIRLIRLAREAAG